MLFLGIAVNNEKTDTSVSAVSVFVDHSNVFIGCGGKAKGFRLDVNALCKLVEQGRSVSSTLSTRVVAGSNPPVSVYKKKNKKRTVTSAPQNDWAKYSALGYTVATIDRSKGKGEGDLPDLILQALALKHIVLCPVPHTIVLVTGDCNGHGHMLFSDLIRAAAKHNALLSHTATPMRWSIEVWSWKKSLSKKWLKLHARHSQTLSVHLLDTFWSSLVMPTNFISSTSSTLKHTSRKANVNVNAKAKVAKSKLVPGQVRAKKRKNSCRTPSLRPQNDDFFDFVDVIGP